jgi:pimeloyl-ACP methyl ester carboxylesterase
MSMTPKPPVIFIHGLWIHSTSWNPWIDLFADHGYTAVAPGWPGDAGTVEATRAHPEALDGIGIEAIFDRYADIIDTMDQKPIVIGHSFGGLIAQELLAHDLAVAAVGIDPAPIKGVKALPFAQLRSGFPILGKPSSKNHTVSLTEHQFRYSFGNAVTEEESNELHAKFTIPGPGRPLFEDASANFSRTSPAAVDTFKTPRGPLLLTSGSLDHTVPEVVTREVVKLYTEHTDSVTDFHEFEGRGHSLAFDSGWAGVANDVLAWLDDNVTPAITEEHPAGAIA